jgi:hypothetical protein
MGNCLRQWVTNGSTLVSCRGTIHFGIVIFHCGAQGTQWHVLSFVTQFLLVLALTILQVL